MGEDRDARTLAAALVAIYMEARQDVSIETRQAALKWRLNGGDEDEHLMDVALRVLLRDRMMLS